MSQLSTTGNCILVLNVLLGGGKDLSSQKRRFRDSDWSAVNLSLNVRSTNRVAGSQSG